METLLCKPFSGAQRPGAGCNHEGTTRLDAALLKDYDAKKSFGRTEPPDSIRREASDPAEDGLYGPGLMPARAGPIVLAVLSPVAGRSKSCLPSQPTTGIRCPGTGRGADAFSYRVCAVASHCSVPVRSMTFCSGPQIAPNRRGPLWGFPQKAKKKLKNAENFRNR